jgi:hypothetical protein
VSKLFGYDFIVQYRQGRLNVVADALSRRDGDSPLLDSLITEPALAALPMPTFQLFADLRAELQASSDLRTRRDAVTAGEHGPSWSVRDGIILHNGLVFIPANAQVLDDVLHLAHTGAHEGIQKTLQRLRANFFVEHDRRVVFNFVRACTTCQRNKTEAFHPAGLLQPLPVPSRVWADISIDFVEALPKVHGKSVILTVVDRFSKYAHFIALGHSYTAVSVVRAFFHDIVRLHGFPESIIRDRDPVFTGRVWWDLFRQAGIQLRLSTAFHPQMDGQSKAVNKTIAIYLRCLIGDRPCYWLDWLPRPSSATTRRSILRSGLRCSPSSTVGHPRTSCHTHRGGPTQR